jgi:hypothetical protein
MNVQVDELLIREALDLASDRTEKDILEQALREYIQRRQQSKIVDLFGTIDYGNDYDYKQQRQLSRT